VALFLAVHVMHQLIGEIVKIMLYLRWRELGARLAVISCFQLLYDVLLCFRRILVQISKINKLSDVVILRDVSCGEAQKPVYIVCLRELRARS